MSRNTRTFLWDTMAFARCLWFAQLFARFMGQNNQTTVDLADPLIICIMCTTFQDEEGLSTIIVASDARNNALKRVIDEFPSECQWMWNYPCPSFTISATGIMRWTVAVSLRALYRQGKALMMSSYGDLVVASSTLKTAVRNLRETSSNAEVRKHWIDSTTSPLAVHVAVPGTMELEIDDLRESTENGPCNHNISGTLIFAWEREIIWQV